MIPEQVIQDWVKNKRRIKDRLNRIKKRLKKLQKQEKHFEMRVRAIQKHEKENRKENRKEEASKDSARNPDRLSGQSVRDGVSEVGSQDSQEGPGNQT